MRLLSLVLTLVCLLAAGHSHAAAALTPDEQKSQSEFDKAYRVPDKDARKNALTILEGAKHSSSWQKLMSVATSDPEAEVRLAAVTALAKAPARDSSVERMLVSLYSNLKFNDFDSRLNYAKAMAPSAFKFNIIALLTEQISKMRYPDVPKLTQTGNGQSNITAVKTAQKTRKEFEEILEAFNAIAQSEVTSPTKDSPLNLTKWFQANAGKLSAADKELADKNKKEDAEAAKAAADAAKAAK